MNKSDRAALRMKFGGRCAYCGCELAEKGWHADHVEPVIRESHFDHDAGKFVATGRVVRPQHERTDNYYPACAPCNIFKSTFSVEFLRQEIAAQVERARKTSSNFRVAERFGLIQVVDKPIKFWFEQYLDQCEVAA